MSFIEIIGVVISSIAAILGGVWFIVQRAFRSGVNNHRLEEVERKVCNAQCDIHQRDITQLGIDLKDIKNDVIAIKSILVIKHKNASDIFSMKNSPRVLNNNGLRLFAEIEGNNFLLANKDFFFQKMDEFRPKTALDVENAANIACTANTDNEIFNTIKNFVYNSPSIIITDKEGNEKTYEVNLADICFILSIPFKRYVLKGTS
jgi:hypothetical protein